MATTDPHTLAERRVLDALTTTPATPREISRRLGFTGNAAARQVQTVLRTLTQTGAVRVDRTHAVRYATATPATTKVADRPA